MYKIRFRNVGNAILKRLAAFIQNAATELQEFTCLSHLKEASPRNLFTLTPSLRRLTLTSHHLDHPRLDSFEPEDFEVNLWAKVPEASHLTHLTLYGKHLQQSLGEEICQLLIYICSARYHNFGAVFTVPSQFDYSLVSQSQNSSPLHPSEGMRGHFATSHARRHHDHSSTSVFTSTIPSILPP